MVVMKKIIYEVHKYIYKKLLPFAYIYEDGTAECTIPIPINIPYSIYRDLIETKRSTTENQKEYIEEWTHKDRRFYEEKWQFKYNSYKEDASVFVNGALMYIDEKYIPSDEKYWDAFVMLQLCTEKHPPFKGFKIKYYGKGAPWIINPDWSPGIVY